VDRDWCSGYHYSDSIITGFSHTHLSGTGIGDLCDISIMPSVGNKTDTLYTISKFSHNNEKASPGYYQVKLTDFNVNVELTAGQRVGFHRYTFPKTDKSLIRLDLGFAINWDRPVDCYIKKIDDYTYAGWRKSTGWAPDQWVYFALKLNKKWSMFPYFKTIQKLRAIVLMPKK
jgi:putative alpha-1,2-mannosidase